MMDQNDESADGYCGAPASAHDYLVRKARADAQALPGIKRKEITLCALCLRGVMHDNNLAFYRISIEQAVANIPAIERAHGLEMLLGGAAKLAHAMGPDEDLAKIVSGPRTALICSDCACGGCGSLASIAEQLFAPGSEARERAT